MAASVAGFASLFLLEHACLHGSEFSSIFVLIKVEALHHIPHHITFHCIDGNGIYADVIINEIWDVTRSLGAPMVTPRPPGRLDGDDADPRSPPRFPLVGGVLTLGPPRPAGMWAVGRAWRTAPSALSCTQRRHRQPTYEEVIRHLGAPGTPWRALVYLGGCGPRLRDSTSQKSHIFQNNSP